MSWELQGRVALVSGAGRGVGRDIALELAALGAGVAVNDISAERAAETVEVVRERGGAAVPAVGDVSDPESVALMVSAATELGPVDILVNNAGIPPEGMGLVPFLESTFDQWRCFVDLNVYGVAHLTRAVLPSMVDRGWGRVVTVSSESARTGDPFLAMYAASKAAGSALMRSLAAEVGRYGITCNTVSLGTIASPSMPADLVVKQARRYPIGRLGRPTDVAPAVAFLVSDRAGWITGQTIPVNGGYART